MPTIFADFFNLAPGADGLQTRVYVGIRSAETIIECYRRVYAYVSIGLKWDSRNTRHDLMDNTVDTTGLDQQQMEDAQKYFEDGELSEWANRARFEYLVMDPQQAGTYGPNVFILKFDAGQTPLPEFACRQVRLYSQIETYNDEYGDQVQYFKDHGLAQAPPNDEINIDPKTAKGRIDPDSAEQKGQLTKFVGGLVTWIEDNYPDVKALLAVTTSSDFFKLAFAPGNDVLTLQALQTMLNSIRDLKDSKPASTRKAFREWVSIELKRNLKFWSNQTISNAYAGFDKLVKTANKKLYGFLMALFADFLSPNTYPGELDPQKRRTAALTAISTIFSMFPAKGPVKNRYDSMMQDALKKVKQAYPKRYTSTLLEAGQEIPANNKLNPVLPEDLANALKEKVDEILRTLPLQLKDGTAVSFFTVQNFADLQALNGNSVIVQNKSKSPVVVPADPKENGVAASRPIYRSGLLIGDPLRQAIAFGNLPDVQGTFYYRPLDTPAIAKVKATTGRNLIIDFQKYTIDYAGKKDKTKNDKGEAYRSGASTVVFFDELKQTTKWTEIKGGRRYDPYYSTNPADAALQEAHLTAFVAAARGAARALPLGDDSLCVWFWAFADESVRPTYQRLGEVLGLPTARQIVVQGSGALAQLQAVNKPCVVEIGGSQYVFVNYGPRQFQTDGFYYSVIGITQLLNPEEFYVQVNAPSPSVAGVLTTDTTKGKSRQLDDKPKSILDLFNFSYYRRITTELDVATNTPRVTQTSKVIQLYSKNDKRKPSAGTEIKWPDDKFDAIAANLPICFNVKENVIQYFLDKQGRGKMINKGNSLYREEKPRQDAGTAMKPIFKKLKPPLSTELSATKVPATAFAIGAMRQSPAVQLDWGGLKVASSNKLPISQEWCHLRGHGDGGEEYPGNFVSGSYHCNTEQLAIETGQRLITQQMAKETYKLHTTAYLLRDATDYKSTVDDQRKSQILTANYLDDQTAYKAMLENNIARKRDERNTGPNKKRKINSLPTPTPRPQPGDVAPLAAYLRYKVMRSETASMGAHKRTGPVETLKKSFDFIFEGQSEFIDKYQFAITSQAVQFALAGKDALDTWYEQMKAELDQKTTT